jgi:hypothetical protein
MIDSITKDSARTTNLQRGQNNLTWKVLLQGYLLSNSVFNLRLTQPFLLIIMSKEFCFKLSDVTLFIFVFKNTLCTTPLNMPIAYYVCIRPLWWSAISTARLFPNKYHYSLEIPSWLFLFLSTDKWEKYLFTSSLISLVKRLSPGVLSFLIIWVAHLWKFNEHPWHPTTVLLGKS